MIDEDARSRRTEKFTRLRGIEKGRKAGRGIAGDQRAHDPTHQVEVRHQRRRVARCRLGVAPVERRSQAQIQPGQRLRRGGGAEAIEAVDREKLHVARVVAKHLDQRRLGVAAADRPQRDGDSRAQQFRTGFA